MYLLTKNIMNVIKIQNFEKEYDDGTKALSKINLKIKKGEIFALLGPNGAGKTTLINAICGIVKIKVGEINVYGHDIVKDYKEARSYIGLVPQELTTDSFETVWNTVNFTRGLFGKKPSNAFLEKMLKRLSLWDKRNSQIRTLSGGMKRRVMIAKALSHEPRILFLDEPSAGVDVELRKSMWNQVRELKKSGVTIILTTHYIEEAEEIADRIGIINKGELSLVEEKKYIIEKLGEKVFEIFLTKKLKKLPNLFEKYNLQFNEDRTKVFFKNNSFSKYSISKLLNELGKYSIEYKDINIRKNSLEKIFIDFIGSK